MEPKNDAGPVVAMNQQIAHVLFGLIRVDRRLKLLCRLVCVGRPMFDFFLNAGLRGSHPSPSFCTDEPGPNVHRERGSTASERELSNQNAARAPKTGSRSRVGISTHLLIPCPAPTHNATIQFRQNLPAGITRDRTHVHAHTRSAP